MAIIKWLSGNVNTAKFRHEPVSFDVHDWRMMREGKLFSKMHGREEAGVLISAKEHIRFIPHITISDINDFNCHGRDFTATHYHFGYRSSRMAITYCYECRGVGKFDWVQKTSPARRPKWIDAHKNFERDVNFYHVYPQFDNYVFAKVSLNPGDEHCPKCQGFGIELDGRHRIFRGMIKIKDRLRMIDTKESHNGGNLSPKTHKP